MLTGCDGEGTVLNARGHDGTGSILNVKVCDGGRYSSGCKVS